MAFPSSLLPVRFDLYILFLLINLVSSNTDFSNDNSMVKLTVSPTSGYLAENIDVRCEITPSRIVSSLSSSKFDNVYLTVKTDSVKPSGMILMLDDSTDRCQLNRDHVHVDVCNATLIRIHISHSILNETLQQIDYSCSKGSSYAKNSYQLIKYPSARYYNPSNTCSCSFVSSIIFILSFLFVFQIEVS